RAGGIKGGETIEHDRVARERGAGVQLERAFPDKGVVTRGAGRGAGGQVQRAAFADVDAAVERAVRIEPERAAAALEQVARAGDRRVDVQRAGTANGEVGVDEVHA